MSEEQKTQSVEPSSTQKSGMSEERRKLLELIGDAIGSICITIICLAGKLTGGEAVLAILGLLGGVNIARQVGTKLGGIAAVLLALIAPVTIETALATTAVVSVASCASTPRQVAHVAITSTASFTATMGDENRRIYGQEVRATIARLRSEHGTFVQYREQTKALREEWEARGEAIRDLDTLVYDAAALNDLASAPNEQRLQQAGVLLDELARTVERLSDSGHLLPGLTIPPEVIALMHSLSAIAGRPADLGEVDSEDMVDAGVDQ